MMDLIDQHIRKLLGPLVDRLLEVEQELEDLRRCGEGAIRIGTFDEVNPATGRATVSHGELKTPSVPYFNPAAGKVSESRHPSKGEQCLLLNYGGGDSGKQTVALPGIGSAAFPPAFSDPDVTGRKYPDGTTSSYDHATHAYTWQNGPFSIKADQLGVEVMFGAVGFRLTPAGFVHIGGRVLHDGVNIGHT
jgi:phage baseplate assembly protein V